LQRREGRWHSQDRKDERKRKRRAESTVGNLHHIRSVVA